MIMPSNFSGSRPTTYAGAFASDRKPSGTIWSDLPSSNTPGQLRGFFEDFTHFTSGVATATAYQNGYYNFLDTSDTITTLVTTPYGFLAIASAATDNNSPCIQMPFRAGFIVFNTRANGGTRIWFEARVKIAQATSLTDCGLFVGLMEESSAANNWMTDDDAIMVDKDHVGFHTLTATPSELDVVHTLAGQVDIEVGGNVATVTNDTWMKLGMKYDPQWGTDGEIRFYVNGSELGSSYRVTDVDQTAFPDGEELSPVIGHKNGDGIIRTTYVDWIGCFQEEV
jgi:hypothetical protein